MEASGRRVARASAARHEVAGWAEVSGGTADERRANQPVRIVDRLPRNAGESVETVRARADVVYGEDRLHVDQQLDEVVTTL